MKAWFKKYQKRIAGIIVLSLLPFTYIVCVVAVLLDVPMIGVIIASVVSFGCMCWSAIAGWKDIKIILFELLDIKPKEEK